MLVLGEALVDVVREPDGTESRSPGGSPMNVAVALGRLGSQVQLRTALGTDADGDLVAEHLAASRVSLLEPRRGRTSTATATIAADGSAEYEFDIHWELEERPPTTATAVHAGSIALFLEPGASAVGQALQDGGGFVSVDPNIRPAMMPSPQEARGRLEELVPVIDVLKISEEDSAWLFPEREPLDVAGRYSDAGVALVVVTRGARGSVLLSRAASVEVAAPRVEVVDTIGAGDSYMGALLFLLLRELRAGDGLSHLTASDLTWLGTFSATAAALTVTRRGADPPTLDQLRGALIDKTWPSVP
ncbi:PfkB family carbohydrate kinase [Naasia aerilata]|uniref:PfkB family carbohydrate kinase n=1 Tax=Naasia aerilata TaxID=1162966 RepID=UPI002572CF61|nr:PfkB family carbohydrate kinase [Naasia aerilata]